MRETLKSMLLMTLESFVRRMLSDDIARLDRQRDALEQRVKDLEHQLGAIPGFKRRFDFRT